MLPRAPRPPRSGSARARAPPGRPGGRAAGRRAGSHASAARHLAAPASATPRAASARSTEYATRRPRTLVRRPSPCRASQLAKAFAASQRPTGRRWLVQTSSTIAAARSRPNAATAARGLSGRGCRLRDQAATRSQSSSAASKGAGYLACSCGRLDHARHEVVERTGVGVPCAERLGLGPENGEGLPDRQPLAAQHRDRVLLEALRAPPSSSARRGAAAAAARRVRRAPRRATTPESPEDRCTTASATSSRNSSAAAVGQ